MTSSYGVIELGCYGSEKAIVEILKDYDGIESISEEGGKIFLKLNKEISGGEINQYLMKNKIVLSHLVKRKPTLEQQFLTITNNH